MRALQITDLTGPESIPGREVAGIVRPARPGSWRKPGDRVAAFCLLGGSGQVAVAPDEVKVNCLLNNTAEALKLLEGREATGEGVLEFR